MSYRVVQYEILRSCLSGLFLSTISLVVSLAVIEVGVRWYQSAYQGISVFDNNGTIEYLDGKAAAKGSSILDSKLGWRPAPSFSFTGTERTADGSEYPLHVTQDGRGFRGFGDPQSSRPRIFVIGDSYTQAVEVSDDKTYYALLGKELGAEVFAVGARGYGTLQEYMVLDRVIEEIKPSVIVWQFCYNDFMGNSYPLEKQWRAGSIGLERPYVEEGSLSYRIPKPYAWLLRLNNGNLRAIPFLTTLLDHWLYRILDKNKDVVLEKILSEGIKYNDFADSVRVTGQLFDRIRTRSDSTPVILFEACTTAPVFHSTIERLAHERGFNFVSDLPAALDRSRARGEVVDSYDRVHFNESGHRIVADTLEPVIKTLPLTGY
jgi:lysophospholipase L1-like esterase